MSRLRFVVDPRARDQIRHSFQWWSEHRSGEQAIRWLRGIEKAMQGLTLNPLRYSLAPENDQFPKEIWQMPFGLERQPSHRVLFTVREDEVYVLSVRHVSQELLGPDDLHGSST